MRDPTVAHVDLYLVGDEDVGEDLLPALELTAHDPMRGVGLAQTAPLVADRAAEVLGRVLVLHLPQALAARAAEHEPDHDVVEHAVDEVGDDRTQHGLAPDPLEVARHGPKVTSPAAIV